MSSRHLSILLLLLLTTLFSSNQAQSFKWPEGKKAAISLSFDDARLTNIDNGLPLFKKHGVRVTYYVNPGAMQPRLSGWHEAVLDGHEIGNHTIHHPCTGNFAWSREKALENYTLASMRQELIEANQQIYDMLGVVPRSFAYTCGQNFVGRGANTKSYVPLVDELFVSGRGWMDEVPNDPMFADMAQLTGIEMDGKDFDTEIKPLIDAALENGSWLLLGGHEIGKDGDQTTRVDMLEKLIAYAQDFDNGIWLAPVGEVADYVNQGRQKVYQSMEEALGIYAPFDQGTDAAFALGDETLYTEMKQEANGRKAGIHNGNMGISAEQGRFGDAMAFRRKGGPALLYRAKDNIAYHTENWSGTVSMWLRLDPEKDLAPGFTDPVQITDVSYKDAAIWVDFSDKNPRSFRMGVYGDLAVWNPKDLPPDKNPAFDERLLPATDRPFSAETWTHVVVTFSGLNNEQGHANFYINGKHQGERNITEPFTWDIEKAKIYLGLNFIGLMDEFAFFNRAFSAEEVKLLYELPDGVGGMIR